MVRMVITFRPGAMSVMMSRRMVVRAATDLHAAGIHSASAFFAHIQPVLVLA